MTNEYIERAASAKINLAFGYHVVGQLRDKFFNRGYVWQSELRAILERAAPQVLPNFDPDFDPTWDTGILEVAERFPAILQWLCDREFLRFAEVSKAPRVGDIKYDVTAEVVSDQPKPSRLLVDLHKLTISLDGVGHDVDSELTLRWIQVLSDHPGDWIASKELANYDPLLDGARTDKLWKYLPDEITRLIDSKPGSGSRITL